MTAIVITATRWGANAIAAAGFVGANEYARPVPAPANDPTRNFLRKGDVIANRGHLVWIAEEAPNALNGNNTFEVFNEYGSVTYRDANGVLKAPGNRFLRKALRMPFHYWRRSLTDLRIGKVYIWH